MRISYPSVKLRLRLQDLLRDWTMTWEKFYIFLIKGAQAPLNLWTLLRNINQFLTFNIYQCTRTVVRGSIYNQGVVLARSRSRCQTGYSDSDSTPLLVGMRRETAARLADQNYGTIRPTVGNSASATIAYYPSQSRTLAVRSYSLASD